MFEVLNPEARKLIKNRLNSIKETNIKSFNNVSDELKNLLDNQKINCKIFGRENSLFIMEKSSSKRTSLEQMTDIIGFRVILDNIDECYKALGVFHSNWNCIPGRFKKITFHLQK